MTRFGISRSLPRLGGAGQLPAPGPRLGGAGQFPAPGPRLGGELRVLTLTQRWLYLMVARRYDEDEPD